MNKLKQLLYKIYRLSWKITQPQTIGVRVFLVKNQQILLVKHTYSNQWFLPGGGLKKGETLEQAIRRELTEELGVRIEKLELFGAYNNFFEGKKDYIILFKSDDFSLPNKKDSEIEQFSFFSYENIPKSTSPGTKRRITEFLENKNSHFGNW
jgi:ADP-ribose pyrophosphatase YjhB (NUDIX family)